MREPEQVRKMDGWRDGGVREELWDVGRKQHTKRMDGWREGGKKRVHEEEMERGRQDGWEGVRGREQWLLE